MKPEQEVEFILHDWLMSKGQHVKKIYFNRTNKDIKKINAGVFKVKGKQQKPDFVIELEKPFFGKEYHVVEIKDANRSRNLYEAHKIIDKYYKNYVEKETTYFIDGEQIEIKSFLVDSQNSLKGYLFNDEKIVDNTKTTAKSKFLAASKFKMIPVKEGEKTYAYVRFLWSIFGKMRKNYEDKLGLGVLINDIETNTPHIMITKYNQKKKRWGQSFWRI